MSIVQGSSVKIIEHLCHACGRHALDVSTVCGVRRKWLCGNCGIHWTGGEQGQEEMMQAIEDRVD